MPRSLSAYRTEYALQTDSVTDEISDSASNLVDDAIGAFPRIGAAIAIIVVGYILVRILRSLLEKTFSRNHTESYTTVISKLISWIALGFVIAIAIAVTFPSVKPVDLLAGLGFFSVAVGFAFQDILENTLSGVLLLFRQPFQSGDQISVNDNEGTVQAITIRETRIRKYDGQLLVVPNRDVYKNAIRVQTNEKDRRIDFVVGVAYEADLDETRQIIVDALNTVEMVRRDPAPEALVNELAAATVNLDARCWVDSSQHEARVARDAAIRAVKKALDDAGIEMPADIIALQATNSLRAALHDRPVTPGGSVDGTAGDEASEAAVA